MLKALAGLPRGNFTFQPTFPYPCAKEGRWKGIPMFRGALRGRFLSTEPVDNSVDYRCRRPSLFGLNCTFVKLVKEYTHTFLLKVQWVTCVISRRLVNIARNPLI